MKEPQAQCSGTCPKASQPVALCKAVKAKFNTLKKNPGLPTTLDNHVLS